MWPSQAEPHSLLTVSPATAPGGPLRLAVVGEVDMLTSAKLESDVLAAIGTAGTDTADLDMSGVTFLDSSGLATLLRLRKELHGRGGTLRIVAPSGIVRRILEITSVLDLFGVATTDPVGEAP